MARGSRNFRVLSWNVNGLRACARKGFAQWLDRCGGDIVGVQEVRARRDQLGDDPVAGAGWWIDVRAAVRPGYSGVGMFARRPADVVRTTLGSPRFDREGRVQLARFGRLLIANVYFPNGNGKDRDNSRVPFKLSFYRRVFDVVQRHRRAGQRVLVMGDFNTAHREIDLARPRDNRETSGFLPRERAELDRWIDAGWVDTFRAFESGPGHYTWWSQRFGVREKNVGWRLDYVLASPNAIPYLRDAFILPEVRGSDHCPVGVDLSATVLGDGS